MNSSIQHYTGCSYFTMWNTQFVCTVTPENIVCIVIVVLYMYTEHWLQVQFLYTCRTISPRSGPTAGGTVLTVNGSNLGAVVADVIVELVNVATMDRVPCAVDTTKYIPGRKLTFSNWCYLQEKMPTDVIQNANASHLAYTLRWSHTLHIELHNHLLPLQSHSPHTQWSGRMAWYTVIILLCVCLLDRVWGWVRSWVWPKYLSMKRRGRDRGREVKVYLL